MKKEYLVSLIILTAMFHFSGLAAENKITYVKKSHDFTDANENKVGFEILVPKGATVLNKDQTSATYSLLLPGGLYEINIHVTAGGAKELSELIFNATLMGGKKILEKTVVKNGFLVIKKEAMGLEEIWFVRNKKSRISVKVGYPKKYRVDALKIANSLIVK